MTNVMSHPSYAAAQAMKHLKVRLTCQSRASFLEHGHDLLGEQPHRAVHVLRPGTGRTSSPRRVLSPRSPRTKGQELLDAPPCRVGYREGDLLACFGAVADRLQRHGADSGGRVPSRLRRRGLGRRVQQPLAGSDRGGPAGGERPASGGTCRRAAPGRRCAGAPPRRGGNVQPVAWVAAGKVVGGAVSGHHQPISAERSRGTTWWA